MTAYALPDMQTPTDIQMVADHFTDYVDASPAAHVCHRSLGSCLSGQVRGSRTLRIAPVPVTAMSEAT